VKEGVILDLRFSHQWVWRLILVWVKARWSLVKSHQCFRGIYLLPLQGYRVSPETERPCLLSLRARFLIGFIFWPWRWKYETSVDLCHTVWCYRPGGLTQICYTNWKWMFHLRWSVKIAILAFAWARCWCVFCSRVFTLCGRVPYCQHFRRMYCFHLQGWTWILKMEASLLSTFIKCKFSRAEGTLTMKTFRVLHINLQ
jgi:hypothetical protein